MAKSTQDDPFTSEDLQRILYEEQCNSEQEGWHFVKRTECVKVWRKVEEDSPVDLIKAFLQFPGIPPTDVSDLMLNIDVRRRWDKNFRSIEIIEQSPNYSLIYWLYKAPPGMSDRDLIQYTTHQKDTEKNLTYIICKNATDDRRPEVPGVVRATTIFSSTLIRPLDDDPNSTKVTMLYQIDPLGWIPKFLVNMIATRSSAEWQEDLTQFYHEVYSKEKTQQHISAE